MSIGFGGSESVVVLKKKAKVTVITRTEEPKKPYVKPTITEIPANEVTQEMRDLFKVEVEEPTIPPESMDELRQLASKVSEIQKEYPSLFDDIDEEEDEINSDSSDTRLEPSNTSIREEDLGLFFGDMSEISSENSNSNYIQDTEINNKKSTRRSKKDNL